MTAAIDKKYEDMILSQIPLGALSRGWEPAEHRLPARLLTALAGLAAVAPAQAGENYVLPLSACCQAGV